MRFLLLRRGLSSSLLSMFVQVCFLPLPAAAEVGSSAAISDKAFNPAISLILDGQYASYSNDATTRDVPGFQLGEEAGGFTQGFALNESELNVQANVDDKFFGSSTISLGNDAGETTVEIEEAWFQTLTLPAGLKVKAGRFFSGVGYINAIHGHATSFVDDPLPYRVMFGGRLDDTGIQVTWTAPTILYMEFGVEGLSGNSFPAAGAARGGAGTWTAFAKFGGDFNVSNSWLASLSRVSAKAVDRPSGGSTAETGPNSLFTGDSDAWMASLVWKWAPNGNPRSRNFKLAAEYISRREDGRLTVDDVTGDYRGDQQGFYVEGVYRFHPQWSAGIRYDSLTADNTVAGIDVPLTLADDNFSPERISAMVDFWNSEFSTLRLQFVRDKSNPVSDNQLIVQYIMTIGAHGAHSF